MMSTLVAMRSRARLTQVLTRSAIAAAHGYRLDWEVRSGMVVVIVTVTVAVDAATAAMVEPLRAVGVAFQTGLAAHRRPSVKVATA